MIKIILKYFVKMPAFKNGQTLIETITAIGIITMAFVAILSLGTASIDFSTQSREDVIASNLAREGIEVVRIIRDSNWLDPEKNAFDNIDEGNWIIGYNSGVVSTTTDSGDISSCNNCKLYLKNGLYQHDPTGIATPYKRLVSIVNIGVGGDKKNIISRVSWTVKGRTRVFNLETNLTDWR